MREKNTTRHGGAAIGAMARADTTSFLVFEKKEKKKMLRPSRWRKRGLIPGGDIGAYFYRAREKVLLMSYNTFRVFVLIERDPLVRGRGLVTPDMASAASTQPGDFDDRGNNYQRCV